MASREMLRKLPSFVGAAVAFLPFSMAMSGAAAAPSPAAQPPYTLSIFAKSANGYSQPDSIVQWRDRVIVGFQNHVAKDGSDGKSSTIVQFSLDGHVMRTFSVPGPNDGLRVVGENDLWALQNEDGNPNLVVIDLESGQAKNFTFAPTVHGGGYDDIVVVHDEVFITASNPNLTSLGENVLPALVRARLSGSVVMIEPVLNGDANATDISTGMTVQLNLTDPDSMTIDPRGNIVLDSQADGELVFIRHPFEEGQQVGPHPHHEVHRRRDNPGRHNLRAEGEHLFALQRCRREHDLPAGQPALRIRAGRCLFGFGYRWIRWNARPR